MFPPHPLRSALTDGVVSGVFIDTKLYLFSRRSSSGKVCRPRPLYANSLTLKSVPYFENLLSGGFAEGVAKILDHDPFEDSDQEEDYDYLYDSDLEDEVESPEPVAKIHDSSMDGQTSNVDGRFRNELNHQGKVVVLRGVSYLTFRAIVMYLYTRDIDFAPFGSKANREVFTTEFLSTEEDTIPRPSPKSIYRAADMYDIPELKELARGAIKRGTKPCDAVEETLSEFTSRYPEMVELHVENLASALLSSNSQDVQEQLDEGLRSFANGEIPHAVNAISALFCILGRYRASGSPPDTSNSNTYPLLGCTWATDGNRKISSHWTTMNIALIRSMHHGSFLDMEYRVRKRRIGVNQFAPIYFSSIVFHSVRSKLDALVHVSNDGVGEEELEVDEDSDYEEESVPGLMGTETNDLAQEGNIPCLNLLPGAFKTWKSLFLFRCLSEITFGPLRSQGTSSSTWSSGEEKRASKALTCSPKSLYHLAELLGLAPLADMAFYDIISKLNSENIVTELFSKFTARDGRLVKKQSLLLTSTLGTPKTTSVFLQYVQEVASGATPHCYDALKLTFGNTVDAIKQEREAREAEVAKMSRPVLKCSRQSPNCREISITDTEAMAGHSCRVLNNRQALMCSACGLLWDGGEICRRCFEAFR